MYDLNLVHRGTGFFVVEKQAGVIVQGNAQGSEPEMVEILRVATPSFHPAHRIDKDTSGLLLVAERPYLQYFQNNWPSVTRKNYLAVIETPIWNEQLVDKLIDGKTAKTHFKVLDVFGQFALVQCTLVQNGRMHQIRKHLRSIGHPIVDDLKYQGFSYGARSGQLLHAWKLEVKIPNMVGESLVEGSWKTFQARIPSDFKCFGFDTEKWDRGSLQGVQTLSGPKNWARPVKVPVSQPALVYA